MEPMGVFCLCGDKKYPQTTKDGELLPKLVKSIFKTPGRFTAFG